MSSGYHRLGANAKGKKLSWDNRHITPSVEGVIEVRPPATSDREAETPATIGFHAVIPDPSPALTRAQATQQGYTGDQCSNCFSMRMQIAGHCMVCADCGTTTGCS